MTRRNASRGFTLIEVLIVMLIISIVSAAAILTVSRNENSHIDNFAKQLTNLLSLSEQQALLQPAVLGVVFTANNTLEFYQYQPSTKPEQKATWSRLSDSVLGPHSYPKGIKLRLKVLGKNIPPSNGENIQPQLIISSSGDPTPFVIQLGKNNEKPRYQISGSEDGNIISARVDENEKE